MNNNRTNNRRRGRGNNNRQQGGQPINRIDSRARGNAPQLLEKYRKLAHDAHLNGDRVTEEYYLQFADHYFRVIADARQRQEEQRSRRDERWQEGGNEADRFESEEASEYSESDYPQYDQPIRRDRNERPREDAAADQRNDERRAPEPRTADQRTADEPRQDGERSPYEPTENPFVRESRNARVAKPRRDERRPRRGREAAAGEASDGEAEPGLDLTALPPAIAAAPVIEAAETVEADAAPKPKRRTRRPRATEEGPGDALETVAN